MKNNFYTAHLSREQFCALSASDAIAGVHQGLFTAQAYVSALLEQAKAHSGLNALISMNPEYSISQAKKIDDLRASGGILGELAGLVIVVKDNINTLVFPTSAGTAALQYFHPTSNAPALQRLLDAGAIILGKANMHELAFGITSTNFAPFAGSVRNPYDLSKIAGGSSGGNAAAIAAGIVSVGLGTDTGGSCRIPAALCGVVGFRPSVGNGGMERRYEEAGIFPISSTRDTIGLLGKSMSDIMLLEFASLTQNFFIILGDMKRSSVKLVKIHSLSQEGFYEQALNT